jgi:chromosome segregation ATPase
MEKALLQQEIEQIHQQKEDAQSGESKRLEELAELEKEIASADKELAKLNEKLGESSGNIEDRQLLLRTLSSESEKLRAKMEAAQEAQTQAKLSERSFTLKLENASEKYEDLNDQILELEDEIAFKQDDLEKNALQKQQIKDFDDNAAQILKEREEELKDKGFARCSASVLVNLRFVNGLFGDEVSVGSERIRIGRTRKKEFMASLNKYLGG